ncbi:MAG: peroxidase-related enzyme [Hyphomicrobiaceae bacterium]|nr:peroxidase-related enzyme [Hyphomicrobiaceae bacterium]
MSGTKNNDEAAMALDLPLADPLPEAIAVTFDKCTSKLGMIPNVLKAYAFDEAKFSAFSLMYNDLMLAPSGLTKLEREMIAVVVSAVNSCVYCLTAHGAAVRQLSGDPVLGETLVHNYRAAKVTAKQRAMLDFAHKLTARPAEIEEADRAALRAAGFSERDLFDIVAVTGFFNMSNRVAAGTDMHPNRAYHFQAREDQA